MSRASRTVEVKVFHAVLTGWSCSVFKVKPKMNPWALQMDGLAALKESLSSVSFINRGKINVSGEEQGQAKA